MLFERQAVRGALEKTPWGTRKLTILDALSPAAQRTYDYGEKRLAENPDLVVDVDALVVASAIGAA